MEQYSNIRTIYIVDGDPALSRSTKCLLEVRYSAVELVTSADEFLSEVTHTPYDTVLLDLDPKKPSVFRLLNQLLFLPDRPHIVVTTHKNTALRPDDIFPGEYIKVLTHPIGPGELIRAVQLAA